MGISNTEKISLIFIVIFLLGLLGLMTGFVVKIEPRTMSITTTTYPTTTTLAATYYLILTTDENIFTNLPINSDFTKDELTFSSITGTLKLEDWSPLALNQDKLTLKNLNGRIKISENMYELTGYASEISLNGVSLKID
jgi:hypothetical protein